MTQDIPDNRRQYHRENVELIAEYSVIHRTVKYRGCTIVNLSRSGAGALFPRHEKLETGDFILMEILTPDTFQRVSAQGEVKRCFKKGNAIFVGIQFQPSLTEEAFHSLCIMPAGTELSP